MASFKYAQSPRQSSGRRGAKRLTGGGQNLKLSTKTAVFERVSLLIGGGGQACRLGGLGPPLAPALNTLLTALHLLLLALLIN